MGRRKGGKVMSKTLFSYRRESRKEIFQTLVSCTEENDESAKSGEEDKGGFFACYLLTSLSPRHKGHTYIGFTVNPRRRIRQHNGEITSGASRTKRKRPWEMVMCIYGFPTNVSALQFEWAWQHPLESCAVRNVATSFKSLSGLANKIKLGLTMLTLPNWQNLNLTVNFFSTKYSKHSVGCPSLPEQMRDQVSSMDELPCYTGIYNMHEDEDEGEGEGLHKDDDDLDGNDFQNKFNVADNISTSEGLPNRADENHRDNYKSTEGTTIHYRSGWWEGDFMRETEDSFNPTGDLNLGYRDLFNSTKANGVELDQTRTKEMPAISDVNNDPPVVNSPISAHEVEVIDLLSPTPGYRIGLKSKKRKVSCVSSGIIDLTKSPIFV